MPLYPMLTWWSAQKGQKKNYKKNECLKKNSLENTEEDKNNLVD